MLLAKSKGEVTYKDISGLHKWFLIILISMGSSVVYTPMYLKNIFYDPLMQAIGCSNADLGMMVSMYGIAAVVCYLPSGIVADKFRMRTLATVGFVGTAALTFVYAALPSLVVCYIIFLGMGVTSILIWWGTRYKVIRLCCEENEYSQKIGISYSIYGLAGLVVGLVNTAIVASFADAVTGVRVMIVFLGAILLIMGVLSYILIPDFKGEISQNSGLFDLKDAVEAFKWPGVIWAALTMFFVYSVYQGATYTTPYMTQAFGADDTLVNVIGLIRTYGIGLLAGPVVGWLATKIKSASKAMVICFLLSIGLLIGFIIMPTTAGVAVVASMVVLFGFTTYGAFSIGSSPLSEIKMPMRIFGTATGLLSVIGFMPDMFIHAWYGSMIDAKGLDAYPQIFGIETALAVIGIFCLAMLLRTVKKHSQQIETEGTE
ncbi:MULTISPECIES: MFS transporter [Slackia]|uniref:Transporter, major facilitator family protein n=1 Tax=Slackia exigua (strain ATCC 700122 / DSM 15923 / CIP 105133 / JCM 11022 / KCTC 5966 / S-7) TaxID=649764 RepID=D0WJ58_SLAES|nr:MULTISPECIES: MFS transporter [Slackia]EEZ60406.1 transporter, major facilitator family protein [Slackia exigua ATCC 700122]EJU33312.1 transporter, major facilitator family protein [Slackia sp. CM382]MCQ5091971.1 MFS transporter [Slackia exigua]STN99768.1 Inner membrane protein yqcE [Slackia exigua]